MYNLLLPWATALICYPIIIISDTTSERKARKLVRHSQFCESSSPTVKAGAPTSSTTKLWSNHEEKELFIFPNSLTVHQTSTLHNTFYFNNTWTKMQLWSSDPVNMQPDKINATLKDLLQRYGLLPPRCWVHVAEAPLRTVGHYHYT